MELIAKDDSEATRYLDHLYDIYNAIAMNNPEVLVLIHCGHINSSDNILKGGTMFATDGHLAL